MSCHVISVVEQNTSINAFEQFELKLQKMCSTRNYVTLEFTNFLRDDAPKAHQGVRFGSKLGVRFGHTGH